MPDTDTQYTLNVGSSSLGSLTLTFAAQDGGDDRRQAVADAVDVRPAFEAAAEELAEVVQFRERAATIDRHRQAADARIAAVGSEVVRLEQRLAAERGDWETSDLVGRVAAVEVLLANARREYEALERGRAELDTLADPTAARKALRACFLRVVAERRDALATAKREALEALRVLAADAVDAFLVSATALEALDNSNEFKAADVAADDLL
jgi:hypothetical protein